MIFRKEIRLLSPKKNSNFFFRFFLLILVLFSSLPAKSQIPDFYFSNQTLSEALVIISDYFETTIAFDSEKLEKIQIDKHITQNNISDILKELLSGTGLTFIKKYGNYLIVDENQGKKISVPVYNLTGAITDRQSGENLSFASIEVGNRNTLISASVNGTFAINKIVSNQLLLQISHIGYNTLDTLISLSGNENNCQIKLQKKDELLDEVNIKTEKLRIIGSNGEASHSTIIPSCLVDFPNLGETDVFRSLQFLPGIAVFENSSKLNIRGGSADQNLVLFDGVTLYNLDHFFGTFSSINPNIIKDIQVFKGGFDSRYGERLSGIVDITGKTGNKLKPRVYGGVNLVSGNITAEIPFSEKLTFIAAARRSYSDMYSSYLMDMLFKQQTQSSLASPTDNSSSVEPKYYFYDLYSKLTFQSNSKESFSVSVYGGKDYLDNSNTMTGNTLNTYTSDFNKWKNYGMSGSWLKQWNNNLFTNFQIGSSGYFNKYYNETSFTLKPVTQQSSDVNTGNPYQTNESNKLTDYSGTLKSTLVVDAKNQLDFGFAVKKNYYSYFKDGNDDFIYDDRKKNSWLYTSFIQNMTQSLKNWKLKTGFRLNYYQISRKFYFEPRISGTRSLGDHFSAKFSVGRYYQFLSKVSQIDSYSYNRDFWVISDGEDHPVLSSNQFIAGGSFKSGNLYIDIEAYYKTLDGLQLYQYFNQYNKNFNNQDPLPPGQNKTRTKSHFSTGSGDAYGLDMMVKYEGRGYTGWLSYSLSKAVQQYSNINNNSSIPAPYDQRHGLTFTNMYRYKKWNFSAVCIFTTGHPYVVDETVDLDFITTRTYGNLPNYKRFDVAANYNFILKEARLKIGTSIINLFNTKNYNDIYTRQFDDVTNSAVENTYVKSLGITPNFFINFEF